jgi:hypothetical protein
MRLGEKIATPWRAIAVFSVLLPAALGTVHGEEGRGSWSADAPPFAGCREVHFEFIVDDGAIVGTATSGGRISMLSGDVDPNGVVTLQSATMSATGQLENGDIQLTFTSPCGDRLAQGERM